jgi:hypothetical protein
MRTKAVSQMMFAEQYPRMYVGVRAGLIDGRHHERLGQAWMLFLWCIMRQTGQGTEGIVARGAVLTYGSIAEEMNCKRGSVREWMRRLIKQRYIRVERDRRGIRIFIFNPKKFRVSETQHSKPFVSVGNPARRVSRVQHSKQVHHFRNKDTYEKLLQNNLLKLLPNNKTTSQPFPSSENQGQTQRERQQQEQTIRAQAEWITAKYKPQPPPMDQAAAHDYVQSCIERAKA